METRQITNKFYTSPYHYVHCPFSSLLICSRKRLRDKQLKAIYVSKNMNIFESLRNYVSKILTLLHLVNNCVVWQMA